jgi:hypothetical protein
MAKHVIVHDLRLTGIAPRADLNVNVNGSDPLRGTIVRIREYALSQSEPITMDIMCHGYESHNDSIGRQSLADAFGGHGLQLCKEGLLRKTVRYTAELYGVVNTITVYACSAAETHPSYVGTDWDGQRLFREMSAYTGATIYAADATQWYWHLPVNLSNACSSVIDFRRFEGNVWRFTPDGSATIVESNSLEAG